MVKGPAIKKIPTGKLGVQHVYLTARGKGMCMVCCWGEELLTSGVGTYSSMFVERGDVG